MFLFYFAHLLHMIANDKALYDRRIYRSIYIILLKKQLSKTVDINQLSK